MNLTNAIIIFMVSSVVIGFAGSRLTKSADRLADLTGIGKALMGEIFLGVITSSCGPQFTFPAILCFLQA